MTGQSYTNSSSIRTGMSGAELRSLRLARGVSAAEVARRLGISRTRVRHIEGQRGVTGGLTRRYLGALGIVL
jgi:transcriptional regulator with XRE-family HTH domain